MCVCVCVCVFVLFLSSWNFMTLITLTLLTNEVYSPISVSDFLSVSLSVFLSTSLTPCLSSYLSLCLPVRLSKSLSFCQYLCLISSNAFVERNIKEVALISYLDDVFSRVLLLLVIYNIDRIRNHQC